MLGEVGQAYQPAGATALVMDPRTGAILALANWPRVDAERPGGRPRLRARRTAPIQFNYEPGSTFKAFTVAGALEEGLIEPDTVFERARRDPGGRPHDRGGARRGDGDADGRRRSWPSSSNVGTVMIGLKLGSRRASTAGCAASASASPPASTCPGEAAAASCPAPKDYSGSSIGNMPIGQGLAVTPIQMAAGLHARSPTAASSASPTSSPATASRAGA